MAENIWKIVVLSFVEASKMTLNYPNVVSAARITGIHPVNRIAPKETGFIKELTPEEQAQQDRIDARKANNVMIILSKS